MDDEVWPTAFPELKDLAVQLQCNICYGYLTTPMITSCSHTFCSLCIRKWIANKQQCPRCSVEMSENTLRKNPLLEEILHNFRNLKEKLSNYSKPPPITNGNVSPGTEKRVGLDITTPSTSRHPDPSTDTPRIKKTTLQHGKAIPKKANTLIIKNSDDESSDEEFVFKAKTPSVPQSSASASLLSPKAIDKSLQPAVKKVACPVCNVSVPERNINVHLDSCLRGEAVYETRSISNVAKTPVSNCSASQSGTSSKSHISPAPSVRTTSTTRIKAQGPRLEPIKKMMYQVMSQNQLKKELKKHNLPTQGDRRVLINRLQKYVVLYNSNCDSDNPQSIADIRQQLEKEEKALANPAPVTSLTKIFKTAKPDTKEHDDARKAYLQENQSSYNQLIEQIKQRQKQQRQKPPESEGPKCSKGEEETVILVESDSGDSEHFSSMKKLNNTKKSVSNIESDSEDDEVAVTKRKADCMSSDSDDSIPITAECVVDGSTQRTRLSAEKKIRSEIRMRADLFDKNSDVEEGEPSTSSTPPRAESEVGRDFETSPVLTRSSVTKSSSPTSYMSTRRQTRAGAKQIAQKPVPKKTGRVRKAHNQNQASEAADSSPEKAQSKTPDMKLSTPNGEESRSSNLTPDMFADSPSSSDIQPGQRQPETDIVNEEDGEEDNDLSQLVSALDDGSSTDFED